MSDTATATAEPAGVILQIPVKGKQTLAFDTTLLNDFSPEVFAAIIEKGMQALLGSAMTKIVFTGLKEGSPQYVEMQQAAMTKALENLERLKAGTVKAGRSRKSKGVSGAVMTEARRLARALVKEEMKRQKIKVSLVEASEITKLANALIEQNPELIEEATANLAKRDAEASKLAIADAVKAVPLSQTKIAAKAKAKADAQSTGSAASAGKVQARAKGKGAPANA